MSGTDPAVVDLYGGYLLVRCPIVLRASYAVSGTDLVPQAGRGGACKGVGSKAVLTVQFGA
eukprot:3941588-Rhodomonas_salina.4